MTFYSIGFHWVRGAMIGFEFVTRDENDGVATFVLDLLILRILFQCGETDDEL